MSSLPRKYVTSSGLSPWTALLHKCFISVSIVGWHFSFLNTMWRPSISSSCSGFPVPVLSLLYSLQLVALGGEKVREAVGPQQRQMRPALWVLRRRRRSRGQGRGRRRGGHLEWQLLKPTLSLSDVLGFSTSAFLKYKMEIVFMFKRLLIKPSKLRGVNIISKL